MKKILHILLAPILLFTIIVTITGCYNNYTVSIPDQDAKTAYYTFRHSKQLNRKAWFGWEKDGRRPLDIVEKPTKEGFIMILSKSPELIPDVMRSAQYRNFSQQEKEEIMIVAVKSDISTAKYVSRNSNVQWYIVKKNIAYASYIDYPTLEIQKYIMEQNTENFHYINNPAEPIQEEAIIANQNNIQFLKNPSYDLQMFIAKTYPNNFDMLKSTYTKPTLIAKRTATLTEKPKSFQLENKNISLKLLSDREIKLINKTKNFIVITSISEYYGDNIHKVLLADTGLSLPPEGTVNWDIRTKVSTTASSMDDEITYGFAVEYKVTGENTPKNLYQTKKYKASDLVQP